MASTAQIPAKATWTDFVPHEPGRYITGFDVEQLSLESRAEWWWDGLPGGPTVLLLVGTVAFAATVAVLGAAWLRAGTLNR